MRRICLPNDALMLIRCCKIIVIALSFSLSLLGLWSSSAHVKTSTTQTHKPDAQSFEKLVLPVLAETCSSCHDDRTASGGLNLGLLAGGQRRRDALREPDQSDSQNQNGAHHFQQGKSGCSMRGIHWRCRSML